MVTTIRKYTGGTHPFLEFACLSTDTKPVDLVPDNSICHEIDTGKKYYFANKAWHEAPARGGSGEGGSLPADFPAEGSANANKFLGFDANGDYAALDAPSGGGAEKFVVTLTEDISGDDPVWEADKTIAEIVAAYEAGKDIACSYEADDYGVVSLPLVSYLEEMNAVFFASAIGVNGQSTAVFAVAFHDDADTWVVGANELSSTPPYSSTNNGQVLGVSSGNLAWVDNYAPLVVTLTTQDGETWESDKTEAEIISADENNKVIWASVNGVRLPFVTDVSGEGAHFGGFIFAGGVLGYASVVIDEEDVTVNQIEVPTN